MKLVKSERGIFEPKMSEEHVLGQIRQLLELNGSRVFRVVERIPWGKTRSEGGIPDLFGWFPVGWKYLGAASTGGGSFVLTLPCHFHIEIKRKGGKLRPRQIAFLERAQVDGVIAFKAESWDECKAEFAKHGIEMRVG